MSELKVFTEFDAFTDAVAEVASNERNELLLAKFGGGIVQFANAVYPGVDIDDIFAQVNQREPEGRGAHFDVYNGYADPEHEWLGHFNLSGSATVRTVLLPEDLAAGYAARYPKQTDEAFVARRHFSAIALEDPQATIATGTIEPLTGFVLPVRANGPHIVHDIVPTGDNPGKFIKLMVPPPAPDVRTSLREKGYSPLDTVLTQALSGAATGNIALEQVSKGTPLGVPGRRRNFPPLPSPGRTRGKCNLD